MSENPQRRWPSLKVTDWADARDSLQLYTQVVGKVRLANEPLLQHWWNVALYLTARGLTTSPMPHPTGPAFQIDFDFTHHELVVATVDGTRASIPLEPRTVADFYTEVMALLDELGVATSIWTMPVEIPGAIDFTEDTTHTFYDPDAVHRFWLMLLEMERVFKVFRGRYVGKSSPVHYFWGAADFAVTRFSGRTAPPHPGGAPNCGPHVMWEAYSHEVSSAGYWPGGPGEEGTFYAYAYPEAPGFREVTVAPEAARWDDELGEFVLAYEVVRNAADPDATLLEFLQTTYEAAADTADWDRAQLERPTEGPTDHG
ncbi:MAG TPA: DUF5996 family protein [Acidimicrobiales bacterium]|nr:DUF5996 family protein [Acidimicrobiales bacterium]